VTATVLAGGRLCEVAPVDRHVLGDPVDVLIDGTTIVEVRPHDPALLERPGAIDARGLLVLPGLVNGHTHSHEILQRGRYPKLPLEVWMHYLRPPLQAFQLTPEEIYVRTLLAATEALRGGATTVVDDVNLFPYADDETIEAVFRAYEDSGLRSFVGVSLFDRQYFRAMPFVEEEMPAALLAQLAATPTPARDDVLSLARALVGRRGAEGRVSACIAPSAPQRCSDELLVELAALARDAGAPAIVHVHETRLQAVTAQREYGCTMVEHLERLGVLGPGLSLIHAVWLTPHDVELLATSGATAQHNPVSNLRLGSGVAPVRALLRAGVNVSLGTDGCGSCVSGGMRDAVRQAALLGSLRGDAWLSAAEALELATVNGAHALGLEGRLGRIEPGYRADLCCYRLDGIAFVPLNDPLRQFAYAEQGHALDTVLVDGRVVMRAGVVASFDEQALLDEARAVHARVLGEIDRSDAFVDQLRPTYERIHRRSLDEAIPPETLPARFEG
jgi:5-methylthioadenosine/S-adenosylhomocysteine deaminase